MQFMLIVRLIQFFIVLLCVGAILGCSNQFIALTEQVNVIELEDFVDENQAIETIEIIKIEKHDLESIEVFSGDTPDQIEPKETVAIVENELEVLKNWSTVGDLCSNRNIFKDLPPDIQKIILDRVRQFIKKNREIGVINS